jgi:MSHA biogenesis protein MshP
MNRFIQSPQRHKSQQGLGLISAIFVITLLALLAAGMAGITANAAKQHSQQILSIRAQSAAQSGIAIQNVYLTKQDSCPKEAMDYTFNTQGLFDCKASVSCSVVGYQNQRFITLSSQGTCGSGFDTASSIIEQRFIR